MIFRMQLSIELPKYPRDCKRGNQIGRILEKKEGGTYISYLC